MQKVQGKEKGEKGLQCKFRDENLFICTVKLSWVPYSVSFVCEMV